MTIFNFTKTTQNSGYASIYWSEDFVLMKQSEVKYYCHNSTAAFWPSNGLTSFKWSSFIHEGAVHVYKVKGLCLFAQLCLPRPSIANHLPLRSSELTLDIETGWGFFYTHLNKSQVMGSHQSFGLHHRLQRTEWKIVFTAIGLNTLNSHYIIISSALKICLALLGGKGHLWIHDKVCWETDVGKLDWCNTVCKKDCWLKIHICLKLKNPIL